MALTPEDVVNKRFQPTKFREGYDQDEVDDFLDEVVIELRRLQQENEELRERVSVADGRTAVEGRADENQVADARRGGQKKSSATSAPTAVPAPEIAAPAPSAAADETAGTNNLLQLARRLHDEHVREGQEKRDALIAEGHANAARLAAEAEAKQRAQISSLDKERTTIEQRIDELRTFEREYRQKLRSYIEGQLQDLEAGGTTTLTGAFDSTRETSKSAQTSSAFKAFGS